MRLGAIPWTRARRALKRGAVLPLGSLEQHGPHLPLETDTLLAQALASRLAARLRLALLPPLPYGLSEEHDDFPGTISLREGLLAELLGCIARSLEQGGARCLIIVNGHGGNRQELERFLGSYKGALRLRALHVQEWARRAFERQGVRPSAIAHADLAETSLYLALGRRPLAPLPPERLAPPELEARAARGEPVKWRAKPLSRSGSIGRLKGASAELGERALEEMLEGIAQELSAWLARARRARRGGRRGRRGR
jgi:creatinine amidohydrolase